MKNIEYNVNELIEILTEDEEFHVNNIKSFEKMIKLYEKMINDKIDNDIINQFSSLLIEQKEGNCDDKIEIIYEIEDMIDILKDNIDNDVCEDEDLINSKKLLKILKKYNIKN